MLARALARDHPRNGGQPSGACRLVEAIDRLDVLQLVVLPDGVEPRQRIPDARRPRALLPRAARHPVVAAVGLGAAEHVVAPTDAILVQQVRQIGPRVVGDPAGRILPLAGRRAGILDRVPAAHRIVLARAARRPPRDHEQMGRQAPRRVRLEHMVLKDEVARVRPIVRNLARVVVSHRIDVDPVRVTPRRERAAVRFVARGAQRVAHLLLEAVHQPAVDVLRRVEMVMRAASVAVERAVVRLHALARNGIG